MNKDAQWWKEYRLKNGEKLKAYKRDRYHAKKAPSMPAEAFKPVEPNQVAKPIPEPPKPKPEPKRCQHAYCTREGHEVNVHGLKAWLCFEHG